MYKRQIVIRSNRIIQIFVCLETATSERERRRERERVTANNKSEKYTLIILFANNLKFDLILNLNSPYILCVSLSIYFSYIYIYHSKYMQLCNLIYNLHVYKQQIIITMACSIWIYKCLLCYLNLTLGHTARLNFMTTVNKPLLSC